MYSTNKRIHSNEAKRKPKCTESDGPPSQPADQQEVAPALTALAPAGLSRVPCAPCAIPPPRTTVPPPLQSRFSKSSYASCTAIYAAAS